MHTAMIEISEGELNNRIQSEKIRVGVIGIGRVGLPTALSFANAGFETVGMDINEDLVRKINENLANKLDNKISILEDEPGFDAMFDRVKTKKKFRATSKIQDLITNSDVILLSLPTPMTPSNVPDYSALELVGRQLHDHLENGTIIIVESTVEPGFVENILIPIIEGSDKKFIVGKDFAVGACPENSNPGEMLDNFKTYARLVGATDEKTRQTIMTIYRHVFSANLIPMPDCKTANAVKLTTNVFRDLNVAFVNELSLVFEKLGIDAAAVMNAAKVKRDFQAHYPGPGVGGPCLPVNSYQYLNTAKRVGLPLRLVEMGRKINEGMPLHVVNLLSDAFKEKNMSVDGATILLLGVSYKPDVKDIQISPAEQIIKELKQLGANIRIYDPYFLSKTVFGIGTETNLPDALSNSDGAILVTSHKEFYDIKPAFLKSKLRNPVFIDATCILNQYESVKAGLVYRGVGRGRV